MHLLQQQPLLKWVWGDERCIFKTFYNWYQVSAVKIDYIMIYILCLDDSIELFPSVRCPYSTRIFTSQLTGERIKKFIFFNVFQNITICFWTLIFISLKWLESKRHSCFNSIQCPFLANNSYENVLKCLIVILAWWFC